MKKTFISLICFLGLACNAQVDYIAGANQALASISPDRKVIMKTPHVVFQSDMIKDREKMFDTVREINTIQSITDSLNQCNKNNLVLLEILKNSKK